MQSVALLLVIALAAGITDGFGFAFRRPPVFFKKPTLYSVAEHKQLTVPVFVPVKHKVPIHIIKKVPIFRTLVLREKVAVPVEKIRTVVKEVPVQKVRTVVQEVPVEKVRTVVKRVVVPQLVGIPDKSGGKDRIVPVPVPVDRPVATGGSIGKGGGHIDAPIGLIGDIGGALGGGINSGFGGDVGGSFGGDFGGAFGGDFGGNGGGKFDGLGGLDGGKNGGGDFGLGGDGFLGGDLGLGPVDLHGSVDSLGGKGLLGNEKKLDHA